MWPDRVSSPGPLVLQSVALPTALRGPAHTLERNRNATLFQWKIHGVVFKVTDGHNEPSSFQEMLMNIKKQCLK